MDLTFKTENGYFNYRACAIIVNNNKLLAMKNDLTPYYYLPGGRVTLHESAENAVLRELKEELGIDAKISRPLWFAQQFFIDDGSGDKFHELCIYFLVDTSSTDLLNRGNKFDAVDPKHHERFEWIEFDNLKNEYLYPLFIKDKIYNLPKNFEILTEYEY